MIQINYSTKTLNLL